MIIEKTSEKSAVVTLLLCIFLGSFGIHRFYVGKWLTGILMLITLGGLGIWYLVDIALIVSNRFTDCGGRVIELAKKPASFRNIMTVFTVFIVAFYGLIISSIIMTIMATGVLVDVAQGQLDAFRSGNMNSAYGYTSTEFQKNTSLENFSGFAHQYRLESNESVSFYDRKINGNSGVVTGKLTLKDGTVYALQYRLEKEGDQWKVTGIGIGVQGNPKPSAPAPAKK
jgi:TM2 domain-containing membrane protein YozV